LKAWLVVLSEMTQQFKNSLMYKGKILMILNRLNI